MASGTQPVRTTLSPATVRDLRRRTVGQVVTPESPRWDEARTPWLTNIDQHPRAVLEVADGDDVVAAVRWAVANGLQISVQPFGHGSGADVSGILLLRTRQLDQIDIDLDRHTAVVGAGVTHGQLSAALAGTGLTHLVGSNPAPSVVGSTITGGLSWFGRALGLGCDSIVSAELVDGTGRVRRVSATEQPDLLWALRGGGGAFGVVLSLEVALHPVPAIYGGSLFWPIEAMPEVLDTFRTVCAVAPEWVTSWFQVHRFPSLPRVPEPVRGRSMVSVAVTCLAERAAAEQALALFRRLPGLEVDTLGQVPGERVPHLTQEPTEPTAVVRRSTLLARFDDEAITGLVAAAGPASGSPVALVQIRHLGGALSRAPHQPGCHGPISEPFTLQAVGLLTPGETVDIGCADVLAAVARASTGRTLMNFQGPHEKNAWWDEVTRRRLVTIKQAVDPVDTIRSNRPVR